MAKIAECDQRTARHLKSMQSKPGITPPVDSPQPKKVGTRFNLRVHLHRIAGVDLTKIDGLNVQTVQTILSEIGVDMSRWETEKRFCSWLGLCPDNRVSGGKVLNRGTRQVVNRAATALRLAAWSLIRSQSALGAQFPQVANSARRPESHNSHGPQARQANLQDAEVRR